MKIYPTTFKYQNIATKHYQNRTFKGGKTELSSSTDNLIKNVKPTTYHRIKSLEFIKPISIVQALYCIAESKNKTIQEALLYNLHSAEEIKEIAIEANSNDFFRNIKVKKLLGMGGFAFVFETTKNNALKIVGMEHFPNKRKPEFFDFPIIKKGSLGRAKYYIEEKAEMNVTKEEAFNLLKKIKDFGFKINDCFYLSRNMQIREDVLNKKRIKLDQFGRGEDGKVYLLDPGCAIAPLKVEKLIGKIKNYIKRLKK